MASAQQRILVIDDDPTVGALVARIARRNGYDAIVTDDPEDFLSKAASWKPLVAIIDLVMPAIDGVQVLRHLGRQGCQARVLLISGFDEQILENASKLGHAYGLNMAGVVRKPFRADALAEVFERLDAENTLSATRLRRALARNEYRLVYQPKYDLGANRVTGVEALMRWTDPTHGPIPPATFIAAAEESGVITALTRWGMEQAIAQQASWNAAGLRLDLAINVSHIDLEQRDFADHFRSLCRDHGVDPASIIFELTESMAMRDEQALGTCLAGLRAAGATLAIDDFGTGYSSLVQLLAQPFAELKIDRSFVATCTSSRDSGIIVKAVVDLAHNLGLTTVAEGVETRGQLDFLRRVGCDQIQGYLISPPVEAAELPEWLAQAEAFHPEQ